MPRIRASLLALTLAALTATSAFARDDRAAAFDKLFEQLDSNRLNPATPEGMQAEIARLRALVPPGDRRRELLYESTACFQPPEDTRAALAYAQRGLAASKAMGDAELEARFQICEASVQDMLGEVQTSLALYTRGIELARRSEHPALVGDGLVLRGNTYSYLGRHAESLMDFMAAQRLYDNSHQAERSEGNLQNIAVAYRRMGESDKAREYLDRSREIARRHEDWSSLAVIAVQMGFLYQDTGRADLALPQFEEAARIARQRLDPALVASTQLALSSAQLELGRYGQALSTVQSAKAGFTSVGDQSNTGMIAVTEARARAGLGQTAQALALYAEAEKVLQADQNDRYLEMMYPHRAALYERTGNAAAALGDYKRYLALREKRLAARAEQRTLMLRQQTDAAQRDFENQRLRTEKTMREQDVQALLKARRWQRIAIALGVALIAVLGLIVGRQIVRTRRLRVLAATDELTGVANRRRIELMGADAVAQSRADERPLCVITFDIDGFKAINDAHGHLVGDQVIARVAETAQHTLRQFDEIGRMGGEEFVVLLPDTAIDAARQVAERLRANVEALNFRDVAPELRVTISVGVTALSPRDAGLSDLLARADQALYQAKAAGRNCVRTT
ncbi:diguanylate cyclase [Lysobacter sp. TY2-98]|uniref:tetratricopeptide repeat-containing diguanylate cyclase n=1 Tax=Lysobacter sp. TY2-98 TaxID=2290922 RepID=UPI000E206FF7|nr:tetratricopeptide repeat-containing diguanylate cyclase [Lysobacter sp. TY2-98]AXK73027.1 diguanylate cyclase [Lysobacter sp. TY2-98]